MTWGTVYRYWSFGWAALSRAATASRASALIPPPFRWRAPSSVRPDSWVMPKTELNELPVAYGAVQAPKCCDCFQKPCDISSQAPESLSVPGIAAPREFSASSSAVVELTRLGLAYAA